MKNTTPEYTENIEDGGGMTANPEIVLLDVNSTSSTELPGLSKFYYDFFHVTAV
jgi:hypothetical protein